MRVELALARHLEPQLDPLIADRFYAMHLPPDPDAWPAVTYSRISAVNIRDLDGVAYRQARIQYTCWARSLGQSQDIAVIIADMDSYRGVLEGIAVLDVRAANIVDHYVAETKPELYYTEVDLIIKFKGGE